MPSPLAIYWVGFVVLWVIGASGETPDERWCRWFVPTFLLSLIFGVAVTIVAIARSS